MSYQVLARKWRPRSFREMVGQTHVLKALINALDSQRLHHAYLFTGTRGVGKTTIARIIAKCLNCETGISSTPCGTCSVCREIDEGRFVGFPRCYLHPQPRALRRPEGQRKQPEAEHPRTEQGQISPFHSSYLPA